MSHNSVSLQSNKNARQSTKPIGKYLAFFYSKVDFYHNMAFCILNSLLFRINRIVSLSCNGREFGGDITISSFFKKTRQNLNSGDR